MEKSEAGTSALVAELISSSASSDAAMIPVPTGAAGGNILQASIAEGDITQGLVPNAKRRMVPIQSGDVQSEVARLEVAMLSMRTDAEHRAESIFSQRRENFVISAREFEVETRAVAEEEVRRSAEAARLEYSGTVDNLRRDANEQIAGHHASITTQAEQAIAQQRGTISQEAEAALQRRTENNW